MSILRGFRYPAALASGLLLTASIFWSLWSFTNVTFELNAVATVPIEFKRTIVDTPVPEKALTEIVEKPPVELPPRIGLPAGPEIDIVTRVLPVRVDAPDVGGGGFVAARDTDVLPIVRIEPDYPQRAASRGIEGWVKVQYTVTGTGSVTDVRVVESSPSGIFDDVSVKAVTRWRYKPKVENAVAVERIGMQTILRFNLEEE